jgi:hypothetical protein
MNDEDARLTPEEEEELIGAVIRRTSGGACGRAEELLAEFGPRRSAAPTPEDVDSADLALLEAHLEHCAACAALARNLAIAAETLPSLAEFEPGPSFTAGVLAATSRAEPATFAERVAAYWHAWLARPRFAYEVAYVATILVLVIVGNPASRLQAASEQTVIAAAAGLERAREAWPAAVARVTPSLEVPASVRALGSATESLIAERAATSGGLGGAWNRILAQWSVTWDWVRGVASDAVSRVSSTLTSIRQAVSQWFNPPATEPGTPVVR